jgi:hypothetical protein
MDFSDLRYLSFEVADHCNMSGAHKFCPVNDSLRYPPHERKEKCPDANIVAFAIKVHDRGFKGLVGFHYYCDPLVDVSRMLRLMDSMKCVMPEVKFILWSNGTLLKQVHRNWLVSFEKVVFTLHDKSIKARIEEITNGMSNVQIADAYYDMRLDLYSSKKRVVGPCIRPSKIELPVNYHGQVRLCCSDYRGWVSIGNIADEDHNKILDAFSEAADLVAEAKVPICWKCRSLPSTPAATV